MSFPATTVSWKMQLNRTCSDALHTLVPDDTSNLHPDGADLIFSKGCELVFIDIGG